MDNYNKAQPQKLQLSDLLEADVQPREVNNPTLDGEALLNEIFEFTGRFIAYPSMNHRIAHILWIVHTHSMEFWDNTPRLAVLSPTKACGKSRVLEVTEPLVPNPVMAVNVTTAYLFRKVGDEAGLPTILYDEIDTVFGRNAGNNEDIRALINAGCRKGAAVGRAKPKGDGFIPEEIPAYCAIALAGIGMNTLPDTVQSRSIIIPMRRRSANESVESWRSRTCLPEGKAIGEKLANWAAGIKDRLDGHIPDMPESVDDRPRDIWEPLISVADAAGGVWPERARVACVALVTESENKTESQSLRLLQDLRVIFGMQDKMFTSSILASLSGIEDAPWATTELNPYRLASLLRQYGIKSKDIRIGEEHRKGYTREDLSDAWRRYLPSIPEKPATSVTLRQTGRAEQ